MNRRTYLYLDELMKRSYIDLKFYNTKDQVDCRELRKNIESLMKIRDSIKFRDYQYLIKKSFFNNRLPQSYRRFNFAVDMLVDEFELPSALKVGV